MGLSRKRQRELNKLKGHAEEVWVDQKDVLDHANQVIREASRQAANYAREEVSPRVRETFDGRVRPVVTSGINAGRSVATATREKLSEDVLPAVSSSIGSALALLEVAKDPRVRALIKHATDTGTAAASKVGIVPAKKSSGAGKYLLIGVGVVAAIGIAYAAWQTLRADDDLWIDDEDIAEQPDDIQAS